MSMEEIFNILPAVFIFLALGIYAIVFLVRVLAEAIFSKLETNDIWRNHVLEALPVVIGILFGWLAQKFPFPSGLTMTSGRIVFGIAAGLMASSVYKKIKSLLPKEETK